jgi:hypothetical protein
MFVPFEVRLLTFLHSSMYFKPVRRMVYVYYWLHTKSFMARFRQFTKRQL